MVSDLFRNSLQEEIAEGSYDRPIGVSLLAVLLVFSGGIVLISQLAALSRLNQVSDYLGISNVLLQGAIGFLGLLGIAAAIGMWLGQKWGWWLALFYFAYAVTRNVNVILSIQSITDQFGASSEGNSARYSKYGIRTAWNGFLLYYLCRENASYYFKTTEIKKWKALLIVFSICIGIFLVTTIIARW